MSVSTYNLKKYVITRFPIELLTVGRKEGPLTLVKFMPTWNFLPMIILMMKITMTSDAEMITPPSHLYNLAWPSPSTIFIFFKQHRSLG